MTEYRKLTATEKERVDNKIMSTKWVENLVNSNLLRGEGWDKVMYQVAEAFELFDEQQ